MTLRAIGAGLGLSQGLRPGVKSSSLDEAGNPVLQPGGGVATGGNGGRRSGHRKSNSNEPVHGSSHHSVFEQSRRRMASPALSSPAFSNEWLVLKVSDNGKALHRREVDGSLLRLRACTKMIELHGGIMHVSQRSNGKAGATFQIKLPCYRLKGARDSSSSSHINNNNQNLRTTAATGATGINLLVRQKVDSSGNSSDHGCFGMRNDFAGPFNHANNGDGDEGEELDWFVPDNAFDLNVPISNRDASQGLDRAESDHSNGSKGPSSYLGNLLGNSNSRNSNKGSEGGGKKAGGGSGSRRGRSMRLGLSSMLGGHGRSSHVPADAIDDSDNGSMSQPLASPRMSVSMPKRPTTLVVDNAAAAGGGGTGDSTALGGTMQTAAAKVTAEPVTIMGNVMDLLGQLGQASVMSNVANVVRGFGSQSRPASRRQSSTGGGGSPATGGRNSRGLISSRNSRNSLADDSASVHDKRGSRNFRTNVQQQLQSQGSERMIPPSRRGSVKEGSSSKLKPPSLRVINESAKVS